MKKMMFKKTSLATTCTLLINLGCPALGRGRGWVALLKQPDALLGRVERPPKNKKYMFELLLIQL
jgi:hypothetical protein